MPRRFTMSTLVTRCQQRCDLEGDDHISSAEWKTLISEQYGDLFSVVAATGLRYFETTSAITADGSPDYAEPADHYATIGIDYLVGCSSAGTQATRALFERRSLYEIMPQERQMWHGMTGEARAYAVVDDQIMLYPAPPTGQFYELIYIYQPPDLSLYADVDLVDLVTPDGEAFLIEGVAVKALAKGQHDVSLAMRERDEARVRLAEWSTLRALNQPRRRFVDDGPYAYDRDQADWWNR